MRALVVGGTGPTGPFLVQGLRQRGYEVTILHRGAHEVPEIPPEVEHLHADPHFRETLVSALAGRTFDLVIATYGLNSQGNWIIDNAKYCIPQGLSARGNVQAVGDFGPFCLV